MSRSISNCSLSLAFSPCPNDTFLFHGWVKGLTGHCQPIAPVLADIQQLNEWLLEGRYPITKTSFFSLAKAQDNYLMLPVGAALGHGCGPKIIATHPFDLSDLSKKRIAIPGVHTTAHLLFDILFGPPKEKIFCPYHKISSLLQSKTVDCGLIIHETRFTFQKLGFVEIADLGTLWESRYQMPLPLGAIAAKRSLGEKRLSTITQAIQDSLKLAWKNPHLSQKFILEHSQEKDLQVIKQHIDLYVNKETLLLSLQGETCIETLFSLAYAKGLIPKPRSDWIFRL